MVFFGAGVAYLSGQNLRMTAVIDKVPNRPRRVIEMGMYLLVILILLMVLWYSVPIIELTSGTQSIVTGFSEGWKYLALPIGAALLLVDAVWRLVRIAKGSVDDSVDLGTTR